MRDDRRLVRQLRQGDRNALRRVYEENKDALLTIATCLLADASAAEDVLHDVFVTFASKARTLRIRGSLKGYLATCVANRARDRLRTRPRQPVPLAAAADTSAPGSEPGAQLVDCEEAERLYDALAELPYEQREVIMLHLHGAMTFRRIAEQQNVSINTAQSRYRYGLEKLRSLLKTGVGT